MSIGSFDVNLLPGFSDAEAKKLAEGNRIAPGMYVAEIEEVKLEGKEHSYTGKDENKNEIGAFEVGAGDHLVASVKFRILAEYNKTMGGRTSTLFLRIFNFGDQALMDRLPHNMKQMHEGSLSRIIELVSASQSPIDTDNQGNKNYVSTLAGAGIIGSVMAIRIANTTNKQTGDINAEIKGFKKHNLHQ